MSKLHMRTEGDTQIVITRHFAAPPDLVYRAHTEPALLQRWLLGPDGWTMPVCINEARPGGRFRYEWVDAKGNGFHITGEFVELQPGERIVHIERMHLPDPTPDSHVVTTFASDGAGGTDLTMCMTLPDAATRAAVLSSGMEHGLEDSYARLERAVFAAPPA
ncbi:MAG: SRPBCC domain-containing protein [Planctomycetes bacterium]|nr:SRPBCC domain-containing protein [Planctomycetota bacterium]MCB9886995.1 SRPBCC domain-containing protein [Planctomycetota bacterium]